MNLPAIEQHPLEPFMPSNAKILMLGSFPPQQKRWAMDFYYPNFPNDMWRIMGLLFHNDKSYFIDQENKTFHLNKIIELLNDKGIAIFDTATHIRRLQDNASDKFLEIVKPTDVKALLAQLKLCKAIMTTGEKATDTLCDLLQIDKPKVGDFVEFIFEERSMRLYRMPSSSRAYPIAIDKKASSYRILFQDLQML